MKAKIKNVITGQVVSVHATTDHPDSSYGQPVWVDDNNQAYFIVGFNNPFYDILEQDNNG